MRMISIVKLIPLRNETGVIYKWEEEPNLLSPLQVLRAKYEPNLGKVVVLLKSGEQLIVDETLKELDNKFCEATS
jgi:hypothetical protein